MSDKTPVMFMDFDGVLNFEGSRNMRRKHKDAPGYLRRASVYVNGWLNLNWSAELVRKLNLLKTEFPYKWVWLTTWTGYTHMLDGKLGVNPDDAVVWDPGTFSLYVDDSVVANHRNSAKLKEVLDWVDNNPDTPFVWVDDQATVLWTPEVAAKVTAPHMVVMPNADLGLTLTDLNNIKTFLSTL